MQHNVQKKRKFLLMLPLFLAPIVGLCFLFFGGQEQPATEDAANAFNANLPAANVKEPPKNKLEIYLQAQKDSAKRNETLLADPFGKSLYDPAPPVEDQQQMLEQRRVAVTAPGIDANERKVTERLDRLMKELNTPVSNEKKFGNSTGTITLPKDDISHLEKLMAAMQTSGTAHDPEMARLEGVLEKLLDIQHPERVKSRSQGKGGEKKRAAYPVSSPDKLDASQTAGFFGLMEEPSITVVEEKNTILAMIPSDQTVQDGATVKLRLLQAVLVGEQLIPQGTFVSGKCQFLGDRVHLHITDISYRNAIYPIALTAYDTDGLQGINVPGAMERDAAKSGISQAIQEVDILNADQSVAAQAAATGLQTAKGLLSKKAKAVKATLKAGHQVLLKLAPTH